MLKIFKTGPHSHRTPLSYPALWPLFEDHITLVDRPSEADLYVLAHVLDIQAAPQELIEDWRARARPVVMLSEEPFWDTIWGKRPLDPVIYVDTSWGPLPVHQLNHCTSDIYHFHRIPYYLLTNPRFERAYRERFARGAARSLQDWQEDLAARTVDLSFMFERREERHHWVEWPQADLTGLCSWRTDLAQACQTGVVERLGQSWQGGPSRFELKGDWHAEKLALMDRRAKAMGALENTHHPDYITEKLFDALACGSVALYWASPGHRVHELGLPEEAWINLHGLEPHMAADRLTAPHPIAATARALQEANSTLAALFGEQTLWDQDRERLAKAVLSALTNLL